MKIALSFLLAAALTVIVSSCDMLTHDNDVLSKTAVITGDQVYVRSNGNVFIDLQSRVKAAKPVTLKVTSEPSQGTLSDMGKGLLQYSPSVGDRRANDFFEFTVFSEDQQVLKIDTVIIVIENDSTKLPCGIFPANDYVFGVRPGVPVGVDVLTNDLLCGADTSSLVVSIYRPTSTFPPYSGQAQVAGHRIVYSPDSAFPGEDKLIYKVYTQGHEDQAAFGMVYFSSGSLCKLAVHDDSFSFSWDELLAGVKLPALQNDTICQATNNYSVNWLQQPLHGTVYFNGLAFLYHLTDSAGVSPSTFTDQFNYEVCIDDVCKRARVDIKVLRDSTITCRLIAVDDAYNLAGTDTLTYLDVLKNDSTCGMRTLSIVSGPRYGDAQVINNQKISYLGHPNPAANDSVTYRICSDRACSDGRVFIRRK